MIISGGSNRAKSEDGEDRVPNETPPAARRPPPTTPRSGVLLANLGTPEAPTARAIRRYLREFLSDRRVIELPRALWLPILYGVVLPLRPRRLAGQYAKIWTDEGAPLAAISKRQAVALARVLQERRGEEVPVALGFRYGNPGIARAIETLESQGVTRVLVLPLYPQYSATTTASVFDAVFAALARKRVMPELRTIARYHDDPGYIAALAQSARAHWETRGRAEHLLLSFHGIPQRYVQAGDPYIAHCRETARLLAETLGLAENQFTVCFQSRFGKAPWVPPYTDATIRELAARGVKTLDTLCPGFAADCLETLEEIAIRNRELFIACGGQDLRYIPALNDAPAHIEALAGIVMRHC